MKILHAGGGGLREIHYFTVKALREAGVNAELVVNQDSHLLESNKPDWLTGWDGDKLGLINKMLDYDLIQSYTMFSIYAWLSRKPYVAYATGSDLRELAREKTFKGRLMKWAFQKANKVLYSNLDLHDVCLEFNFKNAEFIPQIIDVEKYSPRASKVVVIGVPAIFSSSRHDWAIKGNDKVIKAFANYSHANPDARLFLVDWGVDAEKSKALAKRLARDKVIFLNRMSKNELIEYYLACDVVIDQFGLGSFAGVTLEAMACGKPVITQYNAGLAKRLYGCDPPIVNASSEDEILSALRSPGLLARGEASREWVVKHHSKQVVVPRLVKVYNEIKEGLK